MLFSSPEFIFLFLPAVTFLTYALARVSDLYAKIFLIVASAFFYTVSGLTDVLVLIVSLGANFALARAIERGSSLRPRGFLTLGILLDVAILGYFKYFDFLTDTVNTAFGREVSHGEFRHLPLAIPSFTFQQIAFLIDVHRGRISQAQPAQLCLLPVLLPHLIAGPITSYLPISRQVDLKRVFTPRLRNICFGLALFSVGLAKKVLIADPLGSYVRPFFDNPEALGMRHGLALGGRLFAADLFRFLRLQRHGDRPRHACSTSACRSTSPRPTNRPRSRNSGGAGTSRLSNWLRDYIYIPLGGNRRGSIRTYASLIATMLIGGLWHGAGWGFVLWGLAHGTALAVNRFYARAALRGCRAPRRLAADLPVRHLHLDPVPLGQRLPMPARISLAMVNHRGSGPTATAPSCAGRAQPHDRDRRAGGAIALRPARPADRRHHDHAGAPRRAAHRASIAASCSALR